MVVYSSADNNYRDVWYDDDDYYGDVAFQYEPYEE